MNKEDKKIKREITELDQIIFDIFNLSAKCIMQHKNKVMSYTDFRLELLQKFEIKRK